MERERINNQKPTMKVAWQSLTTQPHRFLLNPLNNNVNGVFTMNTTVSNQTATLAEFLKTDTALECLDNINDQLDNINTTNIMLNDAIDWAQDLISCSNNDEDAVLHEIEATAQCFQNIADQLHRLKFSYFEASGAIKRATNAIETFISMPTEANRLMLVQETEQLAYLNIPMPSALRLKLKPFITKKKYHNKFNFSSLNHIAQWHVATIDEPATEAKHTIVKHGGLYFVTMSVPGVLIKYIGRKTHIHTIKATDESHARELAAPIIDFWLSSFKQNTAA